MGYFDNVKERLDKQFISVKDGITFIFHQDNCTYQDAFNLVVKTLIFEQTHLLLTDGFKLKTILICREQDPNSHNAYMTVETLTLQLEQVTLNGTAKDISNIGFGKKRFYEQLLNMGFMFDNYLLIEAQSPDIDYSDCETDGDTFSYYNGLPKEYEALKRSHDRLEQQLADAKSTGSFMMGTPTVAQTEAKTDTEVIKKLREEIADLTAENDRLNEQLSKQAGKPADKQPKNQDSKIVVYLAFVLAQKLPKYRKSNLNINAQQVGEAITIMAQELGLDKDDMHGFKRPDARLRTLINDNKELLNHFENLIKDN